MMSNYVVKTKDTIVQRVLEKMDQRSVMGQQKYGATMMEEIKGEVKDLNRFLVDVQEELMDAILYIESARECIRLEVEQIVLHKIDEANDEKKDS
jgi:hypothetical protein